MNDTVIQVDGPPVDDIGKKREFVRTVTDAASRLFGLPGQAIVVLLRENKPENVGSGGELILDRHSKD